MRGLPSRTGLLFVAAVVCLSLAGCSGSLVTETVKWKGATFYNEKKQIIDVHDGPMSLELRPDGTGHGLGLPRGHQKFSNNTCIDGNNDGRYENRYDGDVAWKKDSDYTIEISFPGSKYLVSDGPGKFAADWTEVRIHTCNWGSEFWSMQIACGPPDIVRRKIPSCP